MERKTQKMTDVWKDSKIDKQIVRETKEHVYKA